VWDALRWLHVMAMAFFVGGQLLLGAAVAPALRGMADRGPMRAIARRFGQGTVISLGVLIATGAALATHLHRWRDPTLHVKLALVAVVAALIIAHMRRPDLHVLDAAIFLVSAAIVWLGVALAH
jgi:uncharacterized membrane protein